MIGSITSAALVSSLNAQSRAVETAAANVSNANTGGYQAAQGQLVSTVPAGVGYVQLPPQGEVDLAAEAVSMLTASNAYAMSIKALGVEAKAEKQVLNILS